jgi:hypothetical protein
MTTYTVNNVEIKTSTRGVTGYEGSTFSPSWTGDSAAPFIAAISNPSDPKLQSLLRAKDRTSLHLGHYADSREAAYVVALYKSNPEAVLTEIRETRHLKVAFPAELYEIPVNITHDEAQAAITEAKAAGKTSTRGPKKVDINNTCADANFAYLRENFDLKAVVAEYGMPAINEARRNKITVGEFITRFKLDA